MAFFISKRLRFSSHLLVSKYFIVDQILWSLEVTSLFSISLPTNVGTCFFCVCSLRLNMTNTSCLLTFVQVSIMIFNYRFPFVYFIADTGLLSALASLLWPRLGGFSLQRSLIHSFGLALLLAWWSGLASNRFPVSWTPPLIGWAHTQNNPWHVTVMLPFRKTNCW